MIGPGTRSPSARQQGAALLSAMLTVALVATFAAAALWQQWRSIEVEAAERARVQSEWILVGGLDWARLVLREDAKSGGPDWLGEPWAVPLQEARLSSFLAADRNASTTTDVDSGVMDAFLSGQMVDLQSLMNVSNLVQGGKLSEPHLAAFARLFEVLGLPQSQLQKLAENLRFALDTSAANGSSPLAPLVPQRVEQLVWLGVPPETVAALQPFVTILPTTAPTPVNLNTAGAEVIQATVPGLSMADAQRLVAARATAPFRDMGQVARVGGIDPTLLKPDLVSIGTRFFEVRSRLRLDKLIVEEHSIVERTGIDVRVLQRWRGPVTPEAAASGRQALGADTGIR